MLQVLLHLCVKVYYQPFITVVINVYDTVKQSASHCIQLLHVIATNTAKSVLSYSEVKFKPDAQKENYATFDSGQQETCVMTNQTDTHLAASRSSSFLYSPG